MSEHDETAKPALHKDNPDPPEGEEGHKGLGSETGAEDGPGEDGRDVTELMPENRGEVRYPDMENPDDVRPEGVPKEGHVDEDADTSHDASTGARD